jgi:hypothetical protein
MELADFSLLKALFLGELQGNPRPVRVCQPSLCGKD